MVGGFLFGKAVFPCCSPLIKNNNVFSTRETVVAKLQRFWSSLQRAAVPLGWAVVCEDVPPKWLIYCKDV